EDGIRDFHVTGVQTCALPILFGRAQIHVFFRYVLKLPFEEQTFLGSKTPVSNHCKNFPFLQSLANGHCEITGIQSDFLYLESEPVDLSIQPLDRKSVV